MREQRERAEKREEPSFHSHRDFVFFRYHTDLFWEEGFRWSSESKETIRL